MIDIVNECTQCYCELRQWIRGDSVCVIVEDPLKISFTVKFDIGRNNTTQKFIDTLTKEKKKFRMRKLRVVLCSGRIIVPLTVDSPW